MATQTWTSLEQSCAIAMGRLPSPVPANPAYDELFLAQFPLATSYAEARIYHEIPFIASYAQDTSTTTTAGQRTVSLAGTALPLVTPEQVRLITPSGFTITTGTLVPFDRVTVDWIDRVYPNPTTVVTPSLTWQGGRYWALVNGNTIVLGPTPDAAYTVVLGGLFQPLPISASNPTTYLSTNYPDLLEAAICVFLAGALNRNFGQSADETGQSMSWELQFNKLLAAAKAEEMRRRGLAPDTPMPPMPAPPARAAR